MNFFVRLGPSGAFSALVFFSAFLGACGDGSVNTAADAGGPAPPECNKCMEINVDSGKCDTHLKACRADKSCAEWEECTDECFKNAYTSDCFATCAEKAQASKNLYAPLAECACQQCGAQCTEFCN